MQMQQTETERILHSPTLNTILMVENTIKSSDQSLLTTADIKKLLPKQVNHNTLKQILIYLENSNKIAVSMKGITWIRNENIKLRNAVEKGLEL